MALKQTTKHPNRQSTRNKKSSSSTLSTVRQKSSPFHTESIILIALLVVIFLLWSLLYCLKRKGPLSVKIKKALTGERKPRKVKSSSSTFPLKLKSLCSTLPDGGSPTSCSSFPAGGGVPPKYVIIDTPTPPAPVLSEHISEGVYNKLLELVEEDERRDRAQAQVERVRQLAKKSTRNQQTGQPEDGMT